jgi:hypothetical protein
MTETAVSYQQSVFSGQFEVGVYALFLRVLIRSRSLHPVFKGAYPKSPLRFAYLQKRLKKN